MSTARCFYCNTKIFPSTRIFFPFSLWREQANYNDEDEQCYCYACLTRKQTDDKRSTVRREWEKNQRERNEARIKEQADAGVPIIQVFETEYDSDGLGARASTFLEAHPFLEMVSAETTCSPVSNPIDGGDRYTLTLVCRGKTND